MVPACVREEARGSFEFKAPGVARHVHNHVDDPFRDSPDPTVQLQTLVVLNMAAELPSRKAVAKAARKIKGDILGDLECVQPSRQRQNLTLIS